MCHEVLPDRWACSCKYIPGQSPGLPDPFVRYCDRRMTDLMDDLPHRACSNPSWSEEDARIPWLCMKCHEVAVAIGSVRTHSKQATRFARLYSDLLSAALYPGGSDSFTQIRLFHQVKVGLVNRVDLDRDIEEFAHDLRDAAMRDYLGYINWRQVWQKEAEALTFRIRKQKPALQHQWRPRPWLLNVKASPIPLEGSAVNVVGILTKFYSAGHLSRRFRRTSVGIEKQSVASLLFERIRNLSIAAARLRRSSGPTPFQLLYADFIEAVHIPSLALLVEEEMHLEELFSKVEMRQNLQVISNFAPGRLTDEELGAARDYVRESLGPALRIWKARYDRLGSDRVNIGDALGNGRNVMLKAIPDSITDLVWDEEEVLFW